ncbi:Mechanosensitive channel MscK precursor [compost metagenome]
MEINRASRTSEITTVAVDGLIAITYMALIVAILVSLARLHRRQADEAQAKLDAQADAGAKQPKAPVRKSGWIVLARLAGHVVVAAAVIATLLGYLNLALFVAQQLVWGAVVLLAASLLLKFADDLSLWVLSPTSRVGQSIVLTTGLNDAKVEQAGVLLSAVLRIGVILLAVLALTAPFGNLNAFFGAVDSLSNGLTIGTTTLRPSSVLYAVLAFLVVWAVMQAFQNWLTNTYLPKTDLDAGARNSISTVTRYLGIIAAVLWGLTALGIGLEKLALVVSALSVGIGFGLQAITQNFVSGLILLAERPVKIGDWVKLGDQEGDIKRISVRSTEIQVGDKSTLIVPNSELITKTIRNMTMGNAQGRIQIQFSVPLSTDVAAVRQILLDSYAEHVAVLADPAPSVFIDSIANGQIAINSFAYVSGPRAVYGVRSDLYFTMLQKFAAAHIALSSPTDIHLVRDPNAPQEP